MDCAERGYNNRLNIVMVCRRDESSGWRIADAVRRRTYNSIVYARLEHSQFGCPTDYHITEQTLPVIQQFVNNADIVHFKGNDVPCRDYLGIKIPNKVKIICSVNGPVFRRPLCGQKPSSLSQGKYPISDYIKNSDYRTAVCPDLNYASFQAEYTQFLIDSESVSACWENQVEPVIGYYDSAAGGDRKGVKQFMKPAFDKLRKLGFKFKELPIKGVPLGVSINMKKSMTIFIDQIADTGCYGTSAVEAMQFGIPVVTYISDIAKEQSHKIEFQNCPVLSPKSKSVDALVSLLVTILSGEVDLAWYSEKTKIYSDYFHGYTNGAKMWDRIYKKVCDLGG